MSKTNIDWCDYTINPVKGLCPMACEYCYARRMYKRFKWNPEIRYQPIDWINREINRIDNRRGAVGENARIFVGSTMELFGDWVSPEYLRRLFVLISGWPQHTFIFLTKQPQNLIKWSPFLSNCWVGVSITQSAMYTWAMDYLDSICAEVKFLSFEPLLDWRIDPVVLAEDFVNQQLDWIIIGQQTPISAKTQPKLEWIREIVGAADKAGIPVFLKNSLSSIWDIDLPKWAIRDGGLRQEFPK